jgi:hypothetical protein
LGARARLKRRPNACLVRQQGLLSPCSPPRRDSASGAHLCGPRESYPRRDSCLSLSPSLLLPLSLGSFLSSSSQSLPCNAPRKNPTDEYEALYSPQQEPAAPTCAVGGQVSGRAKARAREHKQESDERRRAEAGRRVAAGEGEGSGRPRRPGRARPLPPPWFFPWPPPPSSPLLPLLPHLLKKSGNSIRNKNLARPPSRPPPHTF